jgi:hypothetical protein
VFVGKMLLAHHRNSKTAFIVHSCGKPLLIEKYKWKKSFYNPCYLHKKDGDDFAGFNR